MPLPLPKHNSAGKGIFKSPGAVVNPEYRKSFLREDKNEKNNGQTPQNVIVDKI
jgi:hypothetical protein